MTDQEIVRGINNQDEQAFKALVDNYQEMVINVCNSFVHNKEDAMDIAQEVFIKVLDSIHTFRGKSKLSTWLYRIAVNKSLNFIRDRRKKSIFNSLDLLFDKDNGDQVSQIGDASSNSQEVMEYNEKKEALHKAIQQLPKKQKIALTLNKFEELPYKEIAEVMNISVTETGVLINRAKKQIQKKLIQYFKN